MKLKALLATILLACTAADGRTPPPSNHIRVSGEINDGSVKEATDAMEAAIKGGAKYLLIEIDSGGGGIDAGFVLAKAIETSPVPVVCVADVNAMSMAFVIL